MLITPVLASLLTLTTGLNVPVHGGAAPVLQQVSFQGPGIHTVLKDRGGQYSTLWVDANGDGDARDFGQGDYRDPLCFSIDTDIHIGAVIITSVQTNWFDPQEAMVIGKVNGQTVFSSTSVNAIPDGGGWLIIADQFTGSITGATTIDFWEEYDIAWFLIPDVTGMLQLPYFLGTSDHDIHFVTGSSLPSPLYYSYIDIGCRRAAGMDPSNISTGKPLRLQFTVSSLAAA